MDTATNGHSYSPPTVSTELSLGDMMTAYQASIKDVEDARRRLAELQEQLAAVKKAIGPALAKYNIKLDLAAPDPVVAPVKRGPGRPKGSGGGGSKVTDQVLAACKEQPVTVPQIAKAIGGKVATLRTVVTRLFKAGKLTRTGRGLWLAK